MKTINIGIIGYGVVGTGVAALLTQKKELLESRTGAFLTLKTIADIDTATDRGVELGNTVLVNDAMEIINDPEIDILWNLLAEIPLQNNLPSWPLNRASMW